MFCLRHKLNDLITNGNWIVGDKRVVLGWLDLQKLSLGGAQLDIEFIAVFKDKFEDVLEFVDVIGDEDTVVSHANS